MNQKKLRQLHRTLAASATAHLQPFRRSYALERQSRSRKRTEQRRAPIY
jgi:hypothetical protein